jgi:hypothetical protein
MLPLFDVLPPIHKLESPTEKRYHGTRPEEKPPSRYGVVEDGVGRVAEAAV